MNGYGRCGWALGALLAAVAGAPAAAQSLSGALTDIGQVAIQYGSNAYPVSISGDGGTLAGTGADNVAFIWTASSGRFELGAPAGAGGFSATAISTDGSTVVGTTPAGMAFLWTRQGGFTSLGNLNPTSRYAFSDASGVSSDGTVVVGSSASTVGSASGPPELATHPFIWTAATGLVDLTPGSNANGSASAISGNGQVVVGAITPSGPDITAEQTSGFRWTAQGGFTTLAFLAPSSMIAVAAPAAVDSDGGVIVGLASTPSNQFHAVLWNAAGAVSDLGTLGGLNSRALAVNGDGTIVVGYSQTVAGGQSAFRWTSTSGMQDLNLALAQAHVNLGGITLQSATGISTSGQFIAATGAIAGDSQPHGFLVDDTPAAAGIAVPADLAASVGRVGRAASRLMAQAHGLAAPLLGEYEPLDDGPPGLGRSELGGFATIDPATGGATGRIGLGDGLSVRVGLADIQQRTRDADESGAALTALAGRYVGAPIAIGPISLRPVAEIGVWFAPNLPLQFARGYGDGGGTAFAQGSTQGGLNDIYGRLGTAFAVTAADDALLAGEFGREYLSARGWSEAASMQNPFPAQFAAIDTTWLVGKLQAQWTHRFGPHLDTTLYAAGARVLAADGPLSASVAALGPVRAGGAAGAMWAEYGGRVGWRVGPATIDLFAGGVAGGGDQSGSTLHAGAGVRLAF